MSDIVLSVKDLQIEFTTRSGPLRAIDGVSFELKRGEVLGVVGESGAGKSLTGTAVIGLIDAPGRITGGAIHLEGRRIDTLSPDAMRRVRGREIGMIFQDPLTSLDPLMRIGDQLIETIVTHVPMRRAEARLRAVKLLEDVGIPAAGARVMSYPHEFSGGMRQRVVIALALAAEPKVIIADEPTTALDVSVQAQIIALLKKLTRERGMAVMLITHDMGVIAQIATRVAVMYAGRIVEIGPVADVVRRPSHPYSVGLMGSIPSLHSEQPRLRQIPGAMPRLTALPVGCAFNTRCERAATRCFAERPALLPVERQSLLSGQSSQQEIAAACFFPVTRAAEVAE